MFIFDPVATNHSVKCPGWQIQKTKTGYKNHHSHPPPSTILFKKIYIFYYCKKKGFMHMKYTGILNYYMKMYFTVFYIKYKCGVSVMLSEYPSHGGYFLG